MKIISHKHLLDRMLLVRKYFAYGDQIDYFDDPDVIGWTRLGTELHPQWSCRLNERWSRESEMDECRQTKIKNLSTLLITVSTLLSQIMTDGEPFNAKEVLYPYGLP